MTPVVFDLDGTLVDSAPDLLRAANRLLSDHNSAPLDLAELRRFIGNGTPTLVTRILGARDLAHLAPQTEHERFMGHYMADPIGQTRLFPGVIAALETLAAAGHPLGLCTNKPVAATTELLRAFGLSQFMGVVIGGDSLPVLKPDPAPLRAAFAALGRSGVFIGDSEVDAATGQAAKVPFGLYTEGYRKTPASALPQDFGFAHFNALPEQIARFS